MKKKQYFIFAWLIFVSCDRSIFPLETLLPFLDDKSPKVLFSTPYMGEKNLPQQQSVYVQFDQAMNINSCAQAFSISPQIIGFFELSDISLRFTPNNLLNFGSYSFNVTKNCESTNGTDLRDIHTVNFSVGDSNMAGSNPSIKSIFVYAGTPLECNNLAGQKKDIVAENLTNICVRYPHINPIEINFSKEMNRLQTESSIRINPAIPGEFQWSENDTRLVFHPDTKFQYGTRYSLTVSEFASSKSGVRISQSQTYSFLAGGIVGEYPFVQAVGVASQNCPDHYPGVGSTSGANWNANSCYWDNSLPILNPSNYTFRGGDDGSGGLNLSFACADQNTDNFKLIFSKYMEINTTLNAVRLRRLSPPTSIIQLSSWEWKDCQTFYPFGCRVLELRFAEQEASCNGSVFGNAVTLGDFNLQRSDNTPLGFPYYMISVDTSAEDSFGINLQTNFSFTMEAK
ncbi:Ig-like domain-containing protein [Leptospira sp. 96542]|nr:Ig-like domain-containing protein [Leptospira sp. 96542]